MKNLFKKAHKMTRKMVEEYGVDYRTQFSLCLSYLLEVEEDEMEEPKLLNINDWILKGKGIDINTVINRRIELLDTVRETEKASLLKIKYSTRYSTNVEEEIWVPKSCYSIKEA